ncbi:MAG TPA: phytoene/squalene synthase family protein [Pirellulales bacterium]|jgi:phytoene synthase|nr:phytoene/squalene synthase family protein [Pirellulales bacterium]
MSATLTASYEDCRRLARRCAKNFYYSFMLLPHDKRQAMCALYAFSRQTDDLGDNRQPVEARRAALADWRRSLDRGLSGSYDSSIFPALADTVDRYGLPPRYLHALIDGVEMDLDRNRYETFDELREYCYKVASAVGLCCIHIWGFTDDRAVEPALKCGLALQLTNILRDLKEDAEADRIYLPQDELRRFDYTCDDLRRGVVDERFRRLMRFQIERAEQFYDEGTNLNRWLSSDGRTALGTMTGIYRSLLAEIKRLDGDVFHHRVRLTTWRKLQIAGRWLLASPPHPLRPPVGTVGR